MVQEFVVLQCCRCGTYQVCQSAKATKWLCKVCDQKQSIKQFFGRGSAKDCRHIVQSLNTQRGLSANNTDSHQMVTDDHILDYLYDSDDTDDNIHSVAIDVSIPKRQKLSQMSERLPEKLVQTTTASVATAPVTTPMSTTAAPVFWSHSNQLSKAFGFGKCRQFVVK